MFNKCRPITLLKAFLLLFVLAFGKNANSQVLKIGDQFPDLKFNDVFNFDKGTLNISEVGKKPIILDFWSTTCKSCLQSFSKLDSMQKMFGDRIQIILVNNQPFNADSTKHLFEKRKKLYKPDLPFITNDTVLKRLLSPVGLPMIVWIDIDKKIKYITEGISLNSNNVERFLAGKGIDADFYVGKPAYYRSPYIPQLEQSVVYSSFLSLSSRTGQFSGVPDIGESNMTIPELFVFAYNEFDKHIFNKPKRLILEVKDSSKYIRPTNHNIETEWMKKNLFNYVLSVPDRKRTNRFKYMQQDIERYFDLSAAIEKRFVKCLVLIKTSNVDKLKTKGGKDMLTSFSPGDERMDDAVGRDRVFRNRPYKNFSAIIGNVIEYAFHLPFVDETGYSGNVDVSFNGNTITNLTIKGLKKEFNKYDLDLVEQERPIDVLVLKEKIY